MGRGIAVVACLFAGGVLLLVLPVAAATELPAPVSYCRERYGRLFPRDIFERRACAMCYVYLFPSGQTPLALGGSFADGLRPISENNTLSDISDTVYPDPHNSSSLDLICTTLTSDECSKWSSCCKTGAKCCEEQLNAAEATSATHARCLATWDGYSCWKGQNAGSTSIQRCPSFLPYSLSSSELRK